MVEQASMRQQAPVIGHQAEGLFFKGAEGRKASSIDSARRGQAQPKKHVESMHGPEEEM